MTGAGNIALSVFGFVASIFCLFFIVIGILLVRQRRNKWKRNETILSESLAFAFSKDDKLIKDNSRENNSGSKKSEISRSGSSSDSGTYVESSRPHDNPDSRHLSSPECMYHSAESDDSNKTHRSQGVLEFKVSYSNEEKVLKVIVVQCSDLPLSDISSDVYVKVQLLPEKRVNAKTFLQKVSDGLKFNQKFLFSNMTTNQLKATSLHFIVIYFDKWSRENVIGEVLYSLDSVQLCLQNEVNIVKDLSPRELVLKNDSTGELLISICHQPITNRLTVVILKAANLPKLGIANISGDPYVRLRLFANVKCIGKQKTRIKKRTCNPIFNEAFVFDLPAGLDLKNVYMDILVIDNDRMTKSEVIGSVSIGISKSLSGEIHWKEILDNPRNQIAHWHKLNC